jgi:putative PIN family toxin of toxin-antitoxin system
MPRGLKVIIDTNLWISFLLTKQYAFLETLLIQKRVKLIFCSELLNEFIEVVQRPKLSKFFQQEDIENLIDIIDQYAEFIKIKSVIDVCRDKKDNFLLALAVDSKANFLITGDHDLLVIKKIGKTEIVTMSEFNTMFL